MRKAAELPLGLPQQPHKTLVGMHSGQCRTGRQTASIHVALPVVARYHTALAISVAACQDGIRAVRVQLRQQQGRTPALNGVAGGEGAVVSQSLLVLRIDGRLAVVDVGPRPSIVVLGQFSHLIRRNEADIQHAVDGGGGLLRERHSEGFAEHTAHIVDVPVGIGHRRSTSGGIQSLRLTPAVLRFVVGKGLGEGVRRWRKKAYGVGHLGRSEQRLRLLRRQRQSAAKDGKEQ